MKYRLELHIKVSRLRFTKYSVATIGLSHSVMNNIITSSRLTLSVCGVEASQYIIIVFLKQSIYGAYIET